MKLLKWRATNQRESYVIEPMRTASRLPHQAWADPSSVERPGPEHPWGRSTAAPRLQIFVNDLSATGVARNAVAIANAAAEAGYSVRLLTCSSQGELRTEVAAEVSLINLIGDGSNGFSRRAQLRSALKAYRHHSRTWDPDILFSAGNHGHLLSTIAWVGLRGRKILRISNDLDHDFPSMITRLKRGLKFRVLVGLADRIVLVSRALGGSPLLTRQLSNGRAVTIPNGVDIEAAREAAGHSCPHPWARDSSIPIVLAVGRHARQKNFNVLLAAFAHARRERPMRLIILGSGADEIQRLQARAAELSIAGDVDFVPPTSNPFAYMAAATVLALPSLWEGSANVLLEAMACGTPVIASRTAGDAQHVLGGGQYGVLIDPRDEADLAAALLRQTSEFKVRPGKRADSFDRHATMRDYIALFDHQARKGES